MAENENSSIEEKLSKQSHAGSIPVTNSSPGNLEHLCKERPKRPKKHTPIRPIIKRKETQEAVQDIEEGLENFFQSPRNTAKFKTFSPRSEETRKQTAELSSFRKHQAFWERRIKRRKSGSPVQSPIQEAKIERTYRV